MKSLSRTAAAVAGPAPGGRSPLARIVEGSARLRAALASEPLRFDVVASMTLLLLLLAVDDFWYLRIPVTVLALAGLLYRPLSRHPAFWFAVSFFLILAHVRHWDQIYNHKYLMTYFCMALGISRAAENPDETLARNARLLIGLCFLFATVWKATSPDFLDGSFLHFTLLKDGRFETFARLFGGVPGDAFGFNDRAVAELARFGNSATSVLLRDGPGAAVLARWLARWCVLTDAAVALAFLWPGERGVARFRDGLLFLFLLTTYPIASVISFGWVLAAMGFAQVSRGRGGMRLLYLAAFAILPLYNVPFGRIVGFALRRVGLMSGT